MAGGLLALLLPLVSLLPPGAAAASGVPAVAPAPASATGSAAVPPASVPAGARSQTRAGRQDWQLPSGADQRLQEVLLRRFEPPAHRYAPGHRGVDLRAEAGSVVVSPADGVVAYAGWVAGRPVVSVDHDGGHRSSVLPVIASVPVGTRVSAGDPVGRVAGGDATTAVAAHCHVTCVHWGVRLAGEYVDPLDLLHPPVRLLPRHGDPRHVDG